MEGFLKIEPIWEDSEIFEVRFSASNGKFAGVVDCYTQRSRIADLGEKLTGFPKSVDSEVKFTTGERDDRSFISIKFFCTDGAGHISARTKICHNEYYSAKEHEYSSAEFDIAIEPAQIDKFVKSIERVATEKIGNATAEICAGES